MSEFGPTVVQAPKDERDELAALQKQMEETQKKLERAQHDVDQKEAFGKFDVTVPAEGEVNYQEYLDQRPAPPTEGLVRNGNIIQDLDNGNKIASPKAYAEQNGSAQDYYEQVGGLVNEGPYEAPDYTAMSREELFSEREKARELGDRAAEQQLNEALNDPTGERTPKHDSYELMGVMQLAKEAARARLLNDGGKEEQIVREALATHLEMDALSDDTESPEAAQIRHEKEVARYEELVERFVARANADAQHAEQTHDKPSGEGAPSARVEGATAAKPKVEVVAEPVAEAETTEEKSEVAEEAPKEEQSEEKETSRLDKIKGWFKKERRHLQEFGGIAYFSNLARRAGEGVRSVTFDAGVHSGMMDWEVQEKRDRNRKIILIGVSTLAVYALYKGISSDWGNNDTPDINTGAGGGTTPEAPAVDPETQGVLDGTTATGYELPAQPPAEAAPVASEFYNIPQGGTGEDLFANLGIDPAKWYANENTLLEKFPNSFYRMSDGHVGIANPGWLPQAEQDFINTLK